MRARESASDIVQSACREVLQHIDRFRWNDEATARQRLFRVLAHLAEALEQLGAGRRAEGTRRHAAVRGTVVLRGRPVRRQH